MSTLILPEQKRLILPPDPKWAPLHYTKPLSDVTRGEDIAEFTKLAMTAERGFRQDQALTLTDWQRWAVDLILEEKPNGFLRHRQFLLGLPKKNGKSMLGSAIALERLLYGNMGTQIYSAAKNREQAKLVFNYAKKQVKASKVLSRVIKCYRDVLENTSTGAIYKAISSDAGGAQGVGPELIIFDEGHTLLTPNEVEFYMTLRESSGDRAESLLLMITTAGINLESLLGELLTVGIENSESDEPYEDGLGLAWWGAPDDADVFDEQTWIAANPNLAEGLYDWAELRGAFKSAEISGNLNAFKRYRLNQWIRTDGNQMYVTPFQWKQAEKPGETIAKGRKITVGFDGSLSDDSTAFVGIDLETGLMEVLASWHKDPTDDDWTVPREEVLSEQKRIFAEYDVVKMWCDDSFFQTDVMKWAKVHRNVVERIPQSNTRLVPMTEQMKIDLISKEVFHNGDKKFREHFMNSCLSDNGRIYKEARGSKNKIDLAMCAILANGARNKILRRGKAPGRAIVLG